MRKSLIIMVMAIALLGSSTYAEAANWNSVIKGIGKIFTKKPSAKQTQVLMGGAVAGQAVKSNDKKSKK